MAAKKKISRKAPVRNKVAGAGGNGKKKQKKKYA